MARREVLGIPIRSVDILGVRVDDVTMAETMAICRAFIRSSEPHRVVTPNAEFVMAAQSNAIFRRILNESSLAIPDGAGLLLASRILGTPIREQVAGTDVASGLAALCAAEGYRIFLLGGAAGVAELAARQLAARYPGLVVAGTYAGVAGPAADEETRAHVRAAGRIDAILVAYGAQRQEEWLVRNQEELRIPLAIGVGGALDFFSGRVPRAPVIVRRAGFDWLFRLVVQPWRWRRQLALPYFVASVTYAAVRQRGRGDLSESS